MRKQYIKNVIYIKSKIIYMCLTCIYTYANYRRHEKMNRRCLKRSNNVRAKLYAYRLDARASQ